MSREPGSAEESEEEEESKMKRKSGNMCENEKRK